MPLNGSGPISIGGSTAGQSINLELGRAAGATSSLDETSLRSLAGVASGTISLSSFYGKSSFTISSPLMSAYNNATAPTVTINNNGEWSSNGAGGNWGSPTTAGVGSAYDVYVTTGTGTGAATGSARDTWLDLSAARQFSINAAPPSQFRNRTSTYYIRRKSDLVQVASNTLYLESDRSAP